MKKVIPESSKIKKGDPHKFRCPHDHHICTLVPDGRGGKIHRCPYCGRTYT
jgi:hypothetical protein